MTIQTIIRENIYVYILLSLPGVNGGEFHVHVVNRGEDISGSLDDALAGLRHGHRSASGDQHRLVPGAQRQVRHEVTFHQYHLSCDAFKMSNIK